MKTIVEITKTYTQKQKIEVNLPFFYRRLYVSDSYPHTSETCGMIDEDLNQTEVTIDCDGGKTKVEFELEKLNSADVSEVACCFDEKSDYEMSSMGEYMDHFKKALSLLEPK